MAVDNDLLTFEHTEPYPPTGNDAIVRDDETTLITATRSRNTDGEWEVRDYRVFGEDMRFVVETVEQADLAAIFFEVFGADELRGPTGSDPRKFGVPVVVAADGKPAVAAWLRVRGRSRREVADLLSVGDRTVTEYLSRFRRRGVGIPDDVDAPTVGSVIPELPPEMDYSGGEQ